MPEALARCGLLQERHVPRLRIEVHASDAVCNSPADHSLDVIVLCRTLDGRQYLRSREAREAMSKR